MEGAKLSWCKPNWQGDSKSIQTKSSYIIWSK
jgi:hypothetical protein